MRSSRVMSIGLRDYITSPAFSNLMSKQVIIAEETTSIESPPPTVQSLPAPHCLPTFPPVPSLRLSALDQTESRAHGRTLSLTNCPPCTFFLQHTFHLFECRQHYFPLLHTYSRASRGRGSSPNARRPLVLWDR